MFGRMSKHTVKNENIRFNRAGYRSDDEMNESRMMKYATNNTPIVMISKSGMNILVQGLITFYNLTTGRHPLAMTYE